MSGPRATPDGPEQLTLTAAYEHFLSTSGIPEQARADLIKGIRAGEIPHRIGTATEYPKGRTVPADPPWLAPRWESLPPRSLSLTQIPPEALQSGAKFDLLQSSARWRDPETKSIIVGKEITVSRDAILKLRPAPLIETTTEDIVKLQQQIAELRERSGVDAIVKLQQEVGKLKARPGTSVEDIAKLQEEVGELKMRLAPAETVNQPPAGPHPGGSPREYSHEQLLIEAFAHIYTHGLPLSLTALCKAVEEALPPCTVPGDTQFRAILRPLYQRMKQEEDQERE